MDDRHNSDVLTREYYDSLVLVPHNIDGAPPSTACTFLGQSLKTPIMAGAMGSYKRSGETTDISPAVPLAETLRDLGAVMWTGYMGDEEFAQVLQTGVKAIRVIKPLRDEERILRSIEHDERHHALAFAMDIDHSFDRNGRIYHDYNGDMEPKSLEKLARCARHTSLPFIVKGVLSAEDARKCAEAGAAGIVVSHHQNIFPCCAPPPMMLPEIREAAGGKLTIVADCQITTGIDAFKALSLGADAVCCARVLKKCFLDNGAQAVGEMLEKMTSELAGALARTASPDIAHITPGSVRRLC